MLFLSTYMLYFISQRTNTIDIMRLEKAFVVIRFLHITLPPLPHTVLIHIFVLQFYINPLNIYDIYRRHRINHYFLL